MVYRLGKLTAVIYSIILVPLLVYRLQVPISAFIHWVTWGNTNVMSHFQVAPVMEMWGEGLLLLAISFIILFIEILLGAIMLVVSITIIMYAWQFITGLVRYIKTGVFKMWE